VLKLVFLLFFFSSFSAAVVNASDVDSYFASLKSSESNVRSGPGLNFPVKWIVINHKIPISVIDKYNAWLKIQDEDGFEGWIHRSLLGKKQYFVVKNNMAILYKNPSSLLIPIYKLQSGVRGEIKSCRKQWCNVMIANIIGWININDIWG
jgi:SH3-like domain-containing protein